jgi:hypothetical protein
MRGAPSLHLPFGKRGIRPDECDPRVPKPRIHWPKHLHTRNRYGFARTAATPLPGFILKKIRATFEQCRQSEFERFLG